MDFLNKLYESNYFGIGLFAVIAFLVVTFLVVLFFGKKDEKKRKLEATQKVNTENTFKETSTVAPVEIPANPEPVAPINLETASPVSEIAPEPAINSTIADTPKVEPTSQAEPVTPVMPMPSINVEDNNEFVNNLNIEETVRPAVEPTRIEPVVTPVTPIITEQPRVEAPQRVELEPTRIEIPREPVAPIINESVTPVTNESVRPVIETPRVEPITPIIKEEEPKLQINEEPIINTYYKPTEKTETEAIKVPNIDFDSLAKSISKELDELENDSKKYEEIKVTPISEVTSQSTVRQPETFSSVYVREQVKETPKETIELPKRIDLPARKSE